MFATAAKTVDTVAWWSDPIYRGCYPEDGIRLFGKDMVKYAPEDMNTIHQPLDFCAFNAYAVRSVIRAGQDGHPETVPRPLGHAANASGQDISPEILYWGPRFFHERYQLPIFVTENGMTNVDFVYDDGKACIRD